MRILLTNDDGFWAEGLQTLSRTLENKHTVAIVAPDRERSAIGHGITVLTPLRVEEHEISGGKVRGFTVSGTPADCVKLALEALLDFKPDLVISGINQGANLATDVLYSGTVSAAIEGTINGLPAISVSLATRESKNPADFSYAASFISSLLDRLFPEYQGMFLLNVNIPDLPCDQIQGVKVTSLGRRRYINAVHRRTDPRGRAYYWLAGDIEDCCEPGTDVEALAGGKISITPLHFDLTDAKELPKLAELGLEQMLRSL